MICPKCGYQQPDAPECARCGIVVDRYRGAPVAAAALPIEPGGTVSLTPPPPPPPWGGAAAGQTYPGPADLPQPAAGPLRGVRGGQVLAEAFGIYSRNFLPFLAVATVALLPRLVLAGVAVWQAGTGTPAAQRPGIQVLLTLGILITTLFGAQITAAAVTYGVLQDLRGRAAGVGDCLRVGLSAIWSVLGVAFVSGIAIGFATLLCIVPGILLYVRWAVAVPVAVEEKPGVGGALDRSTQLTEGYRWAVFGVMCGIVLISVIAGLSIVLVLGLGSMTRWVPLVQALLDLVTTGLAATAAATLYYRLRSVKESIDVHEIASVFD